MTHRRTWCRCSIGGTCGIFTASSGLVCSHFPGKTQPKQMSPFKWGGRVPEPRRSVWTCSLPLVCYPPYGFPNQCRLRWCRASSRERGREGGRGSSLWRSISGLWAYLLCSSFMLRRSQEGERWQPDKVLQEKKKQFKSLKIHRDWVYLLQIQAEGDLLQYIEWNAYEALAAMRSWQHVNLSQFHSATMTALKCIIVKSLSRKHIFPIEQNIFY